MSKVLSAPGKTFLLGEYLALVGGPSILVATNPRFTLSADLLLETESSDSGTAIASQSHPFQPQSPAGKFLARHDRDFKDYRIRFSDPHHGRGGLGASSAQWALLYAIKNGINIDRQNWGPVLEEYRQCAWSGEGVAPSGADVVSQFCGGLTWFDGVEFKSRELKWNFPNLSFTLLRTGTKLATHEHLKRHQGAPQDILRLCVLRATHALELNDETEFVESVMTFAEALKVSGRTAPTTLEILEQLRSEPWVRATKGCGAMGADVILILHDADATPEAQAWAQIHGLDRCGGLNDLSRGILWEV